MSKKPELKVGTRVRIKNYWEIPTGCTGKMNRYKGKIGKISLISGDTIPYRVIFDDGTVLWYDAIRLEIVPEPKKRGRPKKAVEQPKEDAGKITDKVLNEIISRLGKLGEGRVRPYNSFFPPSTYFERDCTEPSNTPAPQDAPKKQLMICPNIDCLSIESCRFSRPHTKDLGCNVYCRGKGGIRSTCVPYQDAEAKTCNSPAPHEVEKPNLDKVLKEYIKLLKWVNAQKMECCFEYRHKHITWGSHKIKSITQCGLISQIPHGIKISYGYARCSVDDEYNKLYGEYLALERAIRGYKEHLRNKPIYFKETNAVCRMTAI